MKSSVKAFLGVSLLCLVSGLAHASSYGDTIVRFKNSDQTANFFRTCYGYAVFPTVGEAGFIVGAALVRRISLLWVRRISGVLLFALAVVSAVDAAK